LSPSSKFIAILLFQKIRGPSGTATPYSTASLQLHADLSLASSPPNSAVASEDGMQPYHDGITSVASILPLSMPTNDYALSASPQVSTSVFASFLHLANPALPCCPLFPVALDG